jgi:ethanolamine-phosphate cytidylyltransferase
MVLSCKYVDDIVIGAPYIITKDLIQSLNLKKIVHVVTKEDKVLAEHAGVDQFAVAKDMGIYVEEPFDVNELTLE